jgi:SAM-dependent methyltransferase
MSICTAAPEFDRRYAEEQLRRASHPLRRFIKGFYLRSILRDVRGPAIDFGCGAGQLLERLPAGSIGLELNTHLIENLRGRGLDVRRALGDERDFELRECEPMRFRTLVIAHVIEHLHDPAPALHTLLASCRRLGVQRVIVVVPGAKGFASDATHRTPVDRAYVERHLGRHCEGFALTRLGYFPGPWAWIGAWFVFHEMKFVYDLVDPAEHAHARGA